MSLPQKVPLGPVGYFELKAIKTQWTEEEQLPIPPRPKRT